MALTRIKTDQITDLAVTNAKIDNLTIQGGKLANDLVYGSNFTISGNLTVNGATTTVDTTNTVASDPLIVLNRAASGANANDMGLILERGSSTNVAFIYAEATDEFVLIGTTEVGTSTGSINITDYQPLKIARLDADNIRLENNSITTQNTDGNLIITPNGTGILRVETTLITEGDLQVDGNVTLGNASGDGHLINGSVEITADLQVDGDTSFQGNVDIGNDAGDTHTITGTVDLLGDLSIDNININGNTISSTDSNGNVNVVANGTGAFNVANDVHINGNLYVTGSQVAFDVTVSSIEDPVFHLGGSSDESSLTANDGYDRGVFFHHYDTTDKHGFIGWDNSTGEFTFLDDVTEDSLNVFSGTDGTARFGNVKVTSMTATRVAFVGANKELVDNGNFTFITGTNTLNLTGTQNVTGQFNADNLRLDGNTLSSTDTDGNINVTANGAGLVIVDNIRIDGNDISNINSPGEVTVNGGGQLVDFRVATDTNDNTLFVDASADNIGIRTNTPNAGAALHINTTGSIIIPVGTQGQRPGTPTTGMFRFSTTNNGAEVYDGTDWQNLSTNFTVVTSQTFSGDGSTVAFTLNEESSTAASFVAINGVLQQPTVAYGVTGTTLTFTEAPESGDVIEVRKLTTLSTVVNLSDTQGYTTVETERTASDYTVRLQAGQLDMAEFANPDSLTEGAFFNLINGTKTTYDQTAVTAGTGGDVVDTFDKTVYRSAKYLVQVANSGGTAFETSEILVIHNGTTATMTEYGVVSTSGSSLGTFTVAVNGSDVELTYTGAASGNLVKVQATYIAI